MRNKKITFICEGQTEKKVLDALNILGRVIEYNIWQKNISKIIRRLDGKVYVIYDTDIDSNENVKRFIENISILKNQTNFSGAIQQTSNLEDEIIYSSNTINSKQQLVQHFNANGGNDLKSQIIRVTNLREKLNKIDLDTAKLWTKNTTNSLSRMNLKRVHYKELKLKK